MRKIIKKIYLIGQLEVQKSIEQARIKKINTLAKIGVNTTIEFDALIQNSTNDSNRIIIGDNCLIKGYLLVYNHGGNISIGNDCFIGPDTRIWSAKKIQIGNRVLIAHNVNIHDNNSHPLNSKERHNDYIHIIKKGLQNEIDLKEKEIIIEDDAWIGFNCTIFKGVKIGKGAIIGACTVVKEDIPPYAVYVGSPGKIIKYVD
jgi:acetyltransferase-like isoleucine patch superfamily enzyme